jgi:hypothetical protein
MSDSCNTDNAALSRAILRGYEYRITLAKEALAHAREAYWLAFGRQDVAFNDCHEYGIDPSDAKKECDEMEALYSQAELNLHALVREYDEFSSE